MIRINKIIISIIIITSMQIASAVPGSPPEIGNIIMSAVPSTVVADNTSTSTIVATVIDTNGNPIPYANVFFNTNFGNIATAYGFIDGYGWLNITDTQGKAYAAIRSASVGSATVTATSGGLSNNTLVTFTTIVAALSVHVTETPDPVNSGGNSIVTVYVSSGNFPLSNANVHLNSSGGSLSPADGTTSAGGYINSSYTAPSVTTTQTYLICATVTKSGYSMNATCDPITVNPPIAVVSISDITLKVNKTGVVPIMIKNVTNVASVQIILNYNSSVVHVIGVANSSFDTMFSNIDNATGATTIGAFQIASPGLNGNVKLADVTLKAVGGGGDSTALGLTIITLKDTSNNPIPATTSNGTCSLTAGICGDVNDDGVVDISDAMWLAKNRIGIPGYPLRCP